MDIQYSVMASQLLTPSPSDNAGREKISMREGFIYLYSSQLQVSVHLAGISVKVSSTALSKVICLVSFLMAQVTFNFKMSSGVKNWKSRWWLNENQLSGKFKLFIFLFCFNRTHHNIFPDDFTVDQLTILPENIEKINWVLHISTWKKTWYGDHNVNPFFQKEDHRRLLYYVCITFKFSNINPSPLILQLQKFFLTFKVIMAEISSQ